MTGLRDYRRRHITLIWIIDTVITASKENVATQIKARAVSIGFDAVGITSAGEIGSQREHLEAFLSQHRHGDMSWMETRADERAAPQTLWPDAQSVIMLGLNYGPEKDPLSILERQNRGAISVYAQNKDYHDVLKKRLKQLARWIGQEFSCEVKVFVDTAPVMEKPLAHKAGLGWQGKHTNLVSRDAGSWLFLGAIFTTADLAQDDDEVDHCGSCQNCLDICPTNAFPAPYQLDARRCISYLTIEHHGAIPREYRKAIGNRIYGCDDCLAVCPWNKFAERSREEAFHPRETLKAPLLQELAELDDAAFREFFRGSPIKRIKRDRFIRNVLIAIGNSGDNALLSKPLQLKKDPSPIVRGAAIWALSQLLPAVEFNRMAEAEAPLEEDESVASEWRAAENESAF